MELIRVLSIVPDSTMQAVQGWKHLIVLSSCNTYEPQQLPVEQDIHKGAISDTYMLVVPNSCLIGLRNHAKERKSFLVLQTCPTFWGL